LILDPSAEVLSRSALLLTVDTNILGHRQTNEKLKGTTGDAEPGIRAGASTEWPAYHDARLNWKDLEWLKGLARGTPIYLKGVSSPDDVQLAKDHGLAVSLTSPTACRQDIYVSGW
jgi:L-lactate dehydrogenase (cytochrome)